MPSLKTSDTHTTNSPMILGTLLAARDPDVPVGTPAARPAQGRTGADGLTGTTPRHRGTRRWSWPGPDQQLDLLAALRRLPTRQREAVVLTEVCDLDQSTAAEILGISVSALMTHKARGLRTLHERLAGRLAGARADLDGGNLT
ncbi:RNA polymerase sigma factor [Micromonospora sp. WMMD730]|uniref:RNA polymerase sigma factor n=1 Tax=Micromonospora sp. WMMD730 TaxID=3404128 RepID=UPI003B94C6F3